jgi:ABC-2 type transport system permease protein
MQALLYICASTGSYGTQAIVVRLPPAPWARQNKTFDFYDFHLALTPSPLVVVVLLLAPMALSGLGAVIGVLAPNQQVANVLSNLALVVVMFLSPVLVRASALPGILQIAAHVLPPTYATDALRQTLAGRVTMGVGVDLLVLLAFTIGSLYVVTTKLDWRSR